MRVLVAGATGALGREVVNALLGRGHQVRAIGRSASDSRGSEHRDGIVDVKKCDGLREAMTDLGCGVFLPRASVNPARYGRATYAKSTSR